VHFEILLDGYHHASGRLSEDVRQSLLDDLTLSERARAA
jgi:hypothetical protein